MRTVTYKSVEEKANLFFTGKARPTVQDAAALNRFINARYQEFFEQFFWPEWTPVEERKFRPTYASGSTYAAGAEVYFPATRTYYLALKAVPINEAPEELSGSDYEPNFAYWGAAEASYSGDDWSSTVAYVAGDIVFQPTNETYYQCHTGHTNQTPPNGSYWGALVEFERDIDFEPGATSNQGTTATAIGEIKAIWPANPRKHENLLPIAYDLTSDGIVVRGDEPVVWVEFRLRPNEFTGSVWASGTYAAGDQVYYTTTGEYYVAIASVTTEAPTDTTKWTKLDFPYVLQHAVAQAAYADMLKLSGKTSKYSDEYRESRRLLQREFDKIERQQGQTRQLNVMTR